VDTGGCCTIEIIVGVESAPRNQIEGVGLSIGTGGIVALVVFVFVVVALAWAVTYAMKTIPKDVSSEAADDGEFGIAPDRRRPVVADFHVHGDTAEIYYAVPLPDGDVEDHLREILCHDASLVLHEKRAHGLPIDQVTQARVFGQRGGEPVEVDVVDMEEPGVIPEIVAPELVPHAAAAGFDPLAHLAEQEFEIHAGVAEQRAREGLSPFLDEVEIAGSLDARLRAAGVDPDDVSIGDLTRALLDVAGYTVVEIPGMAPTLEVEDADLHTASKAGSNVLVMIVEHRPGEYPELSEAAVNGFAFAVAERNPDRALLVTDAFGPYIVYEKERADPRCRFITRERLQAFVDSFTLA